MELKKDLIEELLKYDSESGKLLWKARPLSYFKSKRACHSWNGRYSGKEAGGLHPRGYIFVKLLGTTYAAHRLIWILHYDNIVYNIDHIDGNPANNLIANLRDVPQKENAKNQKKSKSNTSGVTGVYWFRSCNKWGSIIGQKYLGVFDSFDEAVKARRDSEVENNYHKNHGRG